MKKILVVGMTSNRGGIESVIMSYYRALQNIEFHFDFLSNSKIMAYEDEVTRDGSQVYHITSRHDSVFQFYKELNHFFKENSMKYSAIWANECSLANISYLTFAKRFGISKRIIHCHNAKNGEGKIRGILHSINKHRIRHFATNYWSCSDESSVWFFGKDFRDLPNYRHIINPVDTSSLSFNQAKRNEKRNELALPDQAIVFGNVARFEAQKNHTELIEIFEVLRKIDNHCVLLLVGDGTLQPQIRNMVNEKSLDDAVIFAGERADVEDLYQAMDAFIFPSLFEGLPVAFLEAQANGLPSIISSAIPKEAIVNTNVLKINLVESPDSLAQKIYRWLKTATAKRQDINKLQSSQYTISSQTDNFIHAITQ